MRCSCFVKSFGSFQPSLHNLFLLSKAFTGNCDSSFGLAESLSGKITCSYMSPASDIMGLSRVKEDAENEGYNLNPQCSGALVVSPLCGLEAQLLLCPLTYLCFP